MNKARAKEIRDQLRVIENFLRLWDPIGVLASPEGRSDEYDVYAPAILAKFQAGVDHQTLAQHLHGLAVCEMGLGGDVAHELDFAQQLLAWWASECGESHSTP